MDERVEFEFTARVPRIPSARISRISVFDLFKRKPAQEPATAPDAPPPDSPREAPQAEVKRSWSERLKAGLGVSRAKLSGAVTGAFRRRVLDDQALDELESALLTADVGVEATAHLIAELRARHRRAGNDAVRRLRDAGHRART